jgi:predicted DNA-binding protein (MmcQ/YjbR family)
MNLEKLRAHCLSHPGVTEQIQWGADLVFKVGGKMFCVACTEPAPNVMSFKCDDQTFAELVERDGAIPAPYLARAKWVALETFDTLSERELTPLLTRAYELVRDNLPQKTIAALTASTAGNRKEAVASTKRTVAGNRKEAVASTRRTAVEATPSSGSPRGKKTAKSKKPKRRR